MKTLNDFTGLYPLSKTLRFELKPIGNTLENIQKSGILERDSHRAESYIKVKDIIDRYHKAFIERVLDGLTLKTEDKGEKNSLSEFYLYYVIRNKDKSQKEIFEKIQDGLRKQIANSLSKDEAFKTLDKKELIKVELCDFVQSEEERTLIDEFKDFTTYFTGFHENRKNMYSDKAQSTAIGYRLIHENLPKFIDNISVFDQMNITSVSKQIPLLYSQMEEYLNVNQIAEMFTLNYYNTVLTQSQIDVYNTIIGGKVLEDGTKIQGLNEYINLYNQQQTDKHNRLPNFKPLYKQILSDRNTISWLPEEFESDQQLLDAIKQCMNSLDEFMINTKGGIGNSLMHLLTSLSDYSLDGIYLKNDLQLTDISQKMFGNWGIIQRAIEQDYLNRYPQTKKESDERLEKRKKEYIKGIDSISVAEVNRCLSLLGTPNIMQVESYFAQMGAINTEEKQQENLFACILNAYTEIKELLDKPYPKEKKLSQDSVSVEKIKNLLDNIKSLEHFVKPLLGTGDEAGKDEKFYGEFVSLWGRLNEITYLYDKVRNYMTKKPYSTAKIKLNFDNSTLMDGWDVNKETDNTTVILRKGGLYYLAIMNKKNNKVFSLESIPNTGCCFEKMDYKLLPGANKMLPKVFFSKTRIEEFNPSQEIRDNYAKETHKKGENFNLAHCHALIDFFKSSIQKHEDWKKFGFKFSDTSKYADLSGFYREVEQQGYKLSFRKVSEDYINSLVDSGKIYLFQIYNKDFSEFSKGTPNMHTLYWKMLFDKSNLSNVVYKLNGQAEIFFRKSSIACEKPTHAANLPIDNKNRSNKKMQSVFEYDLIKDKRYTVDKFQFHVPITINFKSTTGDNINQMTNEYIQKADDLHVIGIDRGERHLLYLSVIDMKGEIKEQYSLNEIVNEYNGNVYTTNYHDLLDKREEDRKKARQSWQTINSIKELKEGYLSQVVHKIAQLIVKYNAIVVLEDLNFGFMKGRQKVEKQIYQKFEKMLIDKLNYLVDKKKVATEPGGLLHAYQLASKFESFQKLGKQSGFLYYVPAWNTSKMDPVTGFVNLFTSSDLHYESVAKSKAFFCKFDVIRYNSAKSCFEFKLDYSRFTTRAEGSHECWTLCSQGTRIETFRDENKNMQWNSEEIQLTQEFQNLFEKYDIDINGNLKEAIVSQENKAFFFNDAKNSNDKQKGLYQLFKLMLQMRNSITGKDTDYLISPIENKDGCFFDSRKCADNLPKNADANGAYNIARKGLWAIREIKSSTDLKKLSLAISNKDWLKFAQDKPYIKND